MPPKQTCVQRSLAPVVAPPPTPLVRACVCCARMQEEDALRGMTQDGVLANTARPLAGLEKRTRWLPAESVAYGNVSPAKKEMLTVGAGWG